jgi:hypothetical protein
VRRCACRACCQPNCERAASHAVDGLYISDSRRINGQRLDAQTFALPASWNGTNLTSVTIDSTVDMAVSYYSNILSALEVDDRTPSSSVPEPATLALLGTTLLGLGLIRRRRV